MVKRSKTKNVNRSKSQKVKWLNMTMMMTMQTEVRAISKMEMSTCLLVSRAMDWTFLIHGSLQYILNCFLTRSFLAFCKGLWLFWLFWVAFLDLFLDFIGFQKVFWISPHLFYFFSIFQPFYNGLSLMEILCHLLKQILGISQVVCNGFGCAQQRPLS